MKSKITIDRELCKGCGYCVTACKEKLIVFDGGFNKMGYHPVKAVNIERCDGCGLCAIMCPDIAIEVWREEKQIKNSKFKTQNYGRKSSQ